MPITLESSSKLFPEFQTLGDPVLEGMVLAAAALLVDTARVAGQTPYWLSLLGSSGTGKTFLASRLYAACHGSGSLAAHPELKFGLMSFSWPVLLRKLRDGKYWLVDDVSACNLLLLDEVVLEFDPSGFGRDKLCEILSARVGKWTILTSNLTLEQLEKLDRRIASRLIRGGNVVKMCNTTDWALR